MLSRRKGVGIADKDSDDDGSPLFTCFSHHTHLFSNKESIFGKAIDVLQQVLEAGSIGECHEVEDGKVEGRWY